MTRKQFDALFYIALCVHFQTSGHFREAGSWQAVGDFTAAFICFLYAFYCYFTAKTPEAK